MSLIRIASCDSSELHPALAGGHTSLETGAALGRGGFGEVFECKALDAGKPVLSLAVKILGAAGDAAARAGYENIGLLFDRIRQAHPLRARRGDPPLASLPGLFGLPLLRFEGTQNGQQVYGYVMHRLDAAGYLPLTQLTEGQHPADHQAYLSLPFADRIEIAACLTEALDVLIEELEFLHCDINEPNLWVHLAARRCCLIDFDSGLLLGANRAPATYGKPGEWLAPEILRELKQANSDPLALISRESEFWAVQIAISYLLFLVHPLFFLQTLGDAGVKDYLDRYRWPEMNAADPNWNSGNASFYAWFEQEMQLAPEHFVEAFDTGLRGYFQPSQRHAPSAWVQALLGTGDPPEIYMFAADSEVYVQGMEVRLRWWTHGADTVLLTGVGPVSASGDITLPATHCVTYQLRARNMFGVTEATTDVQVLHLPMPSVLVVPSPSKIVPDFSVHLSGPAFALKPPPLVSGPQLHLPSIPIPAPMPLPTLPALDNGAGVTAMIAALTHEVRSQWDAINALLRQGLGGKAP